MDKEKPSLQSTSSPKKKSEQEKKAEKDALVDLWMQDLNQNSNQKPHQEEKIT